VVIVEVKAALLEDVECDTYVYPCM